MNALAHLFIDIATPKMMGQFGLMDLKGKRICFLDECVVPKEFINSAKELFAGQQVSVDVKHKPLTKIPPMPVIMLSNNDDVVDFTDLIWSSRIERFAVMCIRDRIRNPFSGSVKIRFRLP